MQFQADDEEQEDHAQLGEVQSFAGVRDQPRRLQIGTIRTAALRKISSSSRKLMTHRRPANSILEA
jgi:hypothetical protein